MSASIFLSAKINIHHLRPFICIYINQVSSKPADFQKFWKNRSLFESSWIQTSLIRTAHKWTVIYPGATNISKSKGISKGLDVHSRGKKTNDAADTFSNSSVLQSDKKHNPPFQELLKNPRFWRITQGLSLFSTQVKDTFQPQATHPTWAICKTSGRHPICKNV